MKKIQRIPLIVFIVLIGNLLLAGLAAAHPLGNFTINHYAGLHLNAEGVMLDYVVDMAEIPAFQEITTFDANGNGLADPAEAAAYHQSKCESLQSGLILHFDQRPAELSLIASGVEFPAGAGGLPTLRLSCTFQAPLTLGADGTQVAFRNEVYTGRLGWREIVVSSDTFALRGDLAGMTGSLSQRLTAYPDDLLTAPPDQRAVTFELVSQASPGPSDGPAALAGGASDAAGPDRNDGFTQLINLPRLTLPSILLALAVAFVWGAGHALTPGHGKTIVAAYLVGSRGTIRHALFLGLTTTLTHTAGVFALGFLTLFAAQFILPEQLYPWLGVLSGLLLVGIGLSLFRGRLVGLVSRSTDHHHPHHDHEHHHHHHHPHDPGHRHQHGFGHRHSHLPPGTDDTPVTWRSLLALGISGGLIPCPSALVVMLSAIALQRIGFGLVLIIAFSLGLAGVLTAIGVVWVQARRWFERLPGQGGRFNQLLGHRRLWLALPAASAIFITLVGVGITWRALMQTSLL